jgi:hypothetical protein
MFGQRGVAPSYGYLGLTLEPVDHGQASATSR